MTAMVWTSSPMSPCPLHGRERVHRAIASPDEDTSRWRVNFGFRHQEWEAQITEVIPGKRRAWRTLNGATNAGMVNFHDIGEGQSLMTLHLDYEPKGVFQHLGDEMGVVNRVIQRALEQFKEFTEGYS